MGPATGRFTADFPSHSPAQLFALAADIERYPEFIHWCRQVRVLARDGDALEAETHFGAGPVDSAFRIRAAGEPSRSLTVTTTDGPFRSFELAWTFEPLGQGCRVSAQYRIELRSALVQALARLALPEAERKVLRRFQARAVEIYGGESLV